MTTKTRELTVERYKFYKTQETPLADGKIAEIFGMNINQLNAFKKENDLIGKFDVKKTRVNEVKTFKGSELEKDPVKEPETPLLKENDIAKVRALAAVSEYQANIKVKEKLAARKAETEEKATEASTDPFDALTYGFSQKAAISEPAALKMESVGLQSKKESKNIADYIRNDIRNNIDEESESFKEVKDQLKNELEELRKEKAWLEEQHVKDTAEKDALKNQLEKAKQDSHFMELITKVSGDVKAERFRQNSLYGHQRHEHGKWLAILAEEFGEVAQAMQTTWGWGKESDANDLYKELTHVGAVANAWAEQVMEEREKTGS